MTGEKEFFSGARSDDGGGTIVQDELAPESLDEDNVNSAVRPFEDEDCEAEGEAHDNQSNDEHIMQNEYDVGQGDSDSENGLHDSHLKQGVSRPTASDRNELDLLRRSGSSEHDEPKQHINDSDAEEQMSAQRGQSGDADSETEARKQNIEIGSDDRVVGRSKGKRKASIESDSEDDETVKEPTGGNRKEGNELEPSEERDDRKDIPVKRKKVVLSDSEDEEHEKKPVEKESLLLDGEISACDGGLQSSEKSMAAKLQELGSDSEEEEDGKRTEFGEKVQKNLFVSDSDLVDEEEKMITDIPEQLGDEEEEEFTGFKEEDLEEEKNQSGVSSETAAVKDSDSDDTMGGGNREALRPGESGFCDHPSVPVSSDKGYVVHPKWHMDVETNQDEDCEAEGEAHDNQSNDEHIMQNEYDVGQGDSDSENGLHHSHLEQGVSRPTASDRNELDLLRRSGSSEHDEPKQRINDSDTEEQMSAQRGQSGDADSETEARKQNIEIGSDDRVVGRSKGKRKASIESDSEDDETVKEPTGGNRKESNELEPSEERDDRKEKPVKRKKVVLSDSEDEEHEKKPVEKESLLLDGEISACDGGLQSSEKSMAAKLQELGSEDGKRTEFGEKVQKNLFVSDSDSVDEEEKMITDIPEQLGDEEEEEFTGFKEEDLEEEKNQSGVSSEPAAVKDSDSDDTMGGGNREALRPGESGFCDHPSVPVPSNKGYVVHPKWNMDVEANRDEDCEAEGEAHDNQCNDEHIMQNEYDVGQGDSDSEDGLHDSHLEQGVSRPTASDRNELDLLRRSGSSEHDEPKQRINDSDTEEQMSAQRGQSGDADSETEARKQNIEIGSDDRVVGKVVLSDSEDEEHEKKPVEKESLLLDGEISACDGGLQSPEKSMAAKLQELGSDSEEEEDGKRTEFGEKVQKNLFVSDSDSVDEEEKMITDIPEQLGNEEEEEFTGFKEEDLEEEKSQSGVSSETAAVKDSDSDDTIGGGNREALRPGESGFCDHPSVPVPSDKGYVVHPKWNMDVEANRDEDCEAEGEAHDNQSNDEHIMQNEYDLGQADSDSENGLHDSHLEQGVSRPTASDRNELDLLRRSGSSEHDEPKQRINDSDTEEQMSAQRGQSGDADSETEARKQNIGIGTDDRVVGRSKGKRKASIESDSEDDETVKEPTGGNRKEGNELEPSEERDDRKDIPVKRKKAVLSDSEDEEHEKKPVEKESLLLDGEISACDGGLQSSEKSMAAKLQELGSDSEEEEDGKRTKFGKKVQKNLFGSDSDSVDEEEKMIADIFGDSGDEEEEEFMGFKEEDLEEEKSQLGVWPNWNMDVKPNRQLLFHKAQQLTDASLEDSKMEMEQKPNMPPPKKLRGTRKLYQSQTAKDGTVWVEEAIGSGTASASARRSLFSAHTGPTESAKRKITSVLQSFLCLVDMVMLQTIRKSTIQHAHKTEPDWQLTIDELMAFISILFVRAVMCPVGAFVDCWSENFLVPIIKETMSRGRFISIMQHLRFDNKDTQAERLKTDRFALISGIWKRFTKNCVESFTPGEHMTIDEQLFPTKVRCPFTQYISSKPDKFGIKFWIATDLETKYVCNAFPYLGKDPNRQKGERLAENVVMNLMEPFLDEGRNVTTDNFFTSLSLSKRLLQRNTTVLGTVNKVRRELPPSAKDTAEREEFSTSVLRSGSVSLTIYSPKKKKTVCLMSSLHKDVAIGDDKKRKPNTITDYNHMKCGVDVLDQMARMYSVRSATRRWPVAVFYNMLDLAAVNAYVLYKACTGWKGKRRLFLSLLAKELRCRFMQQKAIEAQRKAAAAIAAVPKPVQTTQCQVQESCNRNRSRFACAKCHKYTCPKCRDDGYWVCKRCKH
ncbi:uncharacterized protein LOC125715113 isoform X11 [Brienomyrus brachyistius]|uniref:uncharacterized protein LOC125715113 isoform X6 n=1 Tax=Brienomyrus brachyistius TaxID=42636 RepID=UPI0020B34173|nr:uncharacterized protein LOC125715113 isoform X6 [Brienomyrus brachyistius]XP_048842319.1 uncharacterized protein LOC125715113 isoform X7 [Brienomyrus brachyistius]XP_048842320.1 uncharacterized protein LOC125715113 isoform X8 [Brienomyrus brachyistius]XP_048842321.1 uncharacterized protein LOC125715113 isoform X9 [Brienomyrus brachyistius]XP_048842322.1 uncharacterized protein LOC125715113 isoform X10 [Brienomyrus brachyistius]XP_048842323.1 uncharacterized protein LOC125715113 isoform X11 